MIRQVSDILAQAYVKLDEEEQAEDKPVEVWRHRQREYDAAFGEALKAVAPGASTTLKLPKGMTFTGARNGVYRFFDKNVPDSRATVSGNANNTELIVTRLLKEAV
jgi:hypothetical protein